MPNSTDQEVAAAYTASTFLFEVDGVEIGRFIEVEGLELRVEVFRHEEGGVNGFVHELPGRLDWPNLILRRGLTKANNLEKWIWDTVGDGAAGKQQALERKTGAVTLLSTDGQRLRSWEFEGAFPVRWRGPRFSINESQQVTEEIEISHRGLRARDLT